MITFEDYLQEVHAKDYHGTDDDMPDAFERWLMDLDTAEVMSFAQMWKQEEERKFIKELQNIDFSLGVLIEDRLRSQDEETPKEQYERVRMK